MTHMPSAAPQKTHSQTQPAAYQNSHTDTLDTHTQLIEDALIDVKAKDITIMNVETLTDVTDRVIIASGTSSRHVKALADHVVEKAKSAGLSLIGMEGEEQAEWILVDLASIVVHIMLPATRAFYDLESLWRDPTGDMAQEALAS